MVGQTKWKDMIGSQCDLSLLLVQYTEEVYDQDYKFRPNIK
jgi:hypothetical protein